MLVLGNGKRTKPRRKRGKSVLFAQELTDEHLITPAVTSADKQVPGEILTSALNIRANTTTKF